MGRGGRNPGPAPEQLPARSSSPVPELAVHAVPKLGVGT